MTIHIYTSTKRGRYPGIYGLGVVATDDGGVEIIKYLKCLGGVTKTVAQWMAVIEALQLVRHNPKCEPADQVIIYSDSDVVVNQANGLCPVFGKKQVPLFDEWQFLMKSVTKNISLTWMDGHNMRQAKITARKALGGDIRYQRKQQINVYRKDTQEGWRLVNEI